MDGKHFDDRSKTQNETDHPAKKIILSNQNLIGSLKEH